MFYNTKMSEKADFCCLRVTFTAAKSIALLFKTLFKSRKLEAVFTVKPRSNTVQCLAFYANTTDGLMGQGFGGGTCLGSGQKAKKYQWTQLEWGMKFQAR